MTKDCWKRWLSIFVLLFAAAIYSSTAFAGFYVIPVGNKAKRIVLVSPKDTPLESGTALLYALNGITDASENNPYLVIIEPGVYDLGSDSLQMKPYVDIEGSGELTTCITATGSPEQNIGTIVGSDNAELRFLTVKNIGGDNYATAIYNDAASPKVSFVTAISSGGLTSNKGIRNTNGSSSVLDNITAEATGSNGICSTISNAESSPIMNNVKAIASGSNTNYALIQYKSSPVINNLILEAKKGSDCYGMYNNLSSHKMYNVVANASGSATISGIFIGGSSDVDIYNLVSNASGGTNNYGLHMGGTKGDITIHSSVITGTTNSIYNHAGYNVKMSSCRLEGDINNFTHDPATLKCCNCSNGDFDPLDSDCYVIVTGD